MPRTFDIIVCDDKELVREKIAGVLSRIGVVRIVGQAAEVAALKNGVGKFRPDIILLDLPLAMSEAETVDEVMGICPDALLFLYSCNPDEYQGYASKTGAEKVIRIRDIETEVIKYCNSRRIMEETGCNALLQQEIAARKEQDHD